MNNFSSKHSLTMSHISCKVSAHPDVRHFLIPSGLLDLTSSPIVYLIGTPLRHPLIFYYGHTAAFFVNKAMVAGIITERIDPHIEFTCAIGVDEMSWDDLNPAHYQWPTVAEVREYRVKVRALIDDLIMSKDLQLPITWESPFWV
mgnify:CR=1 FL=1